MIDGTAITASTTNVGFRRWLMASNIDNEMVGFVDNIMSFTNLFLFALLCFVFPDEYMGAHLERRAQCCMQAINCLSVR